MTTDLPPIDVYTVSFRPPTDSWLGSARHHDLRMDLAAAAINQVDGRDPSLIVFPAGFLRVPRTEARDLLAAALLALSREGNVSLVFGIDLSPDDAWAPLVESTRSFGYACDSGAPRMWPLEQMRAAESAEGKPGPRFPGARCAELAQRRVAILLGSEIFSAPLRKAVALGRPDLIVTLTHAGPTERWRDAIDSLESKAPVILSGGAAGERTSVGVRPSPGWTVETISESRSMTIHRHRPLDDCGRQEEDAAPTQAR